MENYVDLLCETLDLWPRPRGVVHLDKAAEPAVQHTQLSMLGRKPRLLPLPLQQVHQEVCTETERNTAAKISVSQ